MERKETISLSIFLVVIFLGQLYIAERAIFGDDYIFMALAEKNQFFFTENAHPPLPVWSDIILTEIFPLTNRTIRLTSMIFATLTIPLVYGIGKKIWNKESAIVAALITGLSAWHIRASQMNSGSDGGMFTFFFMLTIYCFLRYFDDKEEKWLIGTGISLGLTMLAKETAFLLLPILGVTYWIKTGKEWKEGKKEWITTTTRRVFVCLFFALALFSIFPILDMLYNDGQSINAIQKRVEYVTQQENVFFLEIFSIFKIAIWAGPLFLIGFLLWMKEKREWKNMLFITISSVLLFYLFLTPATLDRTRYLMVTIPAFSLICADWITTAWKRLEMRKKEGIILCIGTLFFFGIFLWINQENNIVSYESEQNPWVMLKQGKTNFSIPVFTETDNSGFLLGFNIFFISYGVALLCGVILWTTKKKTAAKIAMLIFLSISIAYNGVVAEEYGLHWTSPDYSSAIKELSAYAKTAQLEEPIYLLKNYELQWYLQNIYDDFVSEYGISETDEKKIEEFKQSVEQSGGTIIFTNMPPIDQRGELWKMINKICSKEYAVADKGIEIGWVFRC